MPRTSNALWYDSTAQLSRRCEDSPVLTKIQRQCERWDLHTEDPCEFQRLHGISCVERYETLRETGTTVHGVQAITTTKRRQGFISRYDRCSMALGAHAGEIDLDAAQKDTGKRVSSASTAATQDTWHGNVDNPRSARNGSQYPKGRSMPQTTRDDRSAPLWLKNPLMGWPLNGELALYIGKLLAFLPLAVFEEALPGGLCGMGYNGRKGQNDGHDLGGTRMATRQNMCSREWCVYHDTHTFSHHQYQEPEWEWLGPLQQSNAGLTDLK